VLIRSGTKKEKEKKEEGNPLNQSFFGEGHLLAVGGEKRTSILLENLKTAIRALRQVGREEEVKTKQFQIKRNT